MKLEFRKLRADEIDIRAAICTEKGATLLLYKDARCDMNILDETVSPMGWMRQHSRDNANCTVSIWDEDKSMWISKEDTGTESNTEAEKGLASDSFKRACFNWGIGRALYTAPFIWVPAGVVRIEKNHRGKLEVKDKLHVSDIKYAGDAISDITIVKGDGTVVFTWTKKAGSSEIEQSPNTTPHNDDSDTERCVVCNRPVTDGYYNKDGQEWIVSRERVISRAKERFGVCMCFACCSEAAKHDSPDYQAYDARAVQEVVA